MVSWAAWVLTGAMAAAPPPRAQVVPSLVKVRPGLAPRPASSEASFTLARGECEAVQLVLPASVKRSELHGPVRLRGAAGSSLELTALRERFLEVKKPSNSQGGTGLWPDALVPTSAPATPGAPHVFWLEACAPASQPAGAYTGQVTWRADGVAGVPVPVRIEVEPFTLPATSSLPTSFGISLYSIAKGHKLDSAEPQTRALLAEYGRMMLAHRLSAHGFYMDAPPVRFARGQADIDFSAYDREVGPFLDGTALPSGARFTSIDVRDSPQAKSEADRVAYFRAYAAHFREKGWKTPLFYYAKDEPKAAEAALVRSQASRVRRAGGIPVLVTSPFDPLFAPSADILTPTLNCFFARPGLETCRKVLPLERLRAALPARTEVWWYQSCNSHGCKGSTASDPAVEAAYRGWASYMADHPAPLNRAMGPLAFRTGIDGELYFDTVYAFNTQDPWKSIFEFGGNGDGTLFYPGTPAQLGGARHAPVASLRLKHIRDGLEDYEYLKLLRDAGEDAFAGAAAARLVRSGYDIELNLATWASVRREMTAKLRAHANAAPANMRPVAP